MAFDASTISLPSSRASDSIATVIQLTPDSVAEESRKETTAVILMECQVQLVTGAGKRHVSE
jgi:hypothetical protein